MLDILEGYSLRCGDAATIVLIGMVIGHVSERERGEIGEYAAKVLRRSGRNNDADKIAYSARKYRERNISKRGRPGTVDSGRKQRYTKQQAAAD